MIIWSGHWGVPYSLMLQTLFNSGFLSQHFIHWRGSTLIGGQAEIHITQSQDAQEDNEDDGVEPSHRQQSPYRNGQ